MLEKIIIELRERKAKMKTDITNINVKSIFWDQKTRNFSVFLKKGRSFNYAPPANLSVGKICDYIVKKSTKDEKEKRISSSNRGTKSSRSGVNHS